MYWIGLIILSIAISTQHGTAAGFILLGGGMIMFAVINALLLFLSRKD
jgi:hypothetical protein